MRKALCFFVIILSFYSCQKEIKKTISVEEKEIKPEPYFNFAEDIFMSIYDLSEKTTAIIININDTEKQTKFDKIFENIDFKNSISNDFFNNTKDSKNINFVDTLGEYKLIKNSNLTNEIKKNVDEKYYVYGTKGYSEMKINDVVIGLDDCKTSIIGLTIKNFDTLKNGKPLLCSRKLLKLEYKNNYSKIETLIQKYYESKKYDYTDNIKTKVFANIDSIYFTYNDDFVWGKHPNNSKCLYPTRAIIRVNKNREIETLWTEGLDLFGIPCD
jgi:hypothetical protein